MVCTQALNDDIKEKAEMLNEILSEAKQLGKDKDVIRELDQRYKKLSNDSQVRPEDICSAKVLKQHPMGPLGPYICIL